MDLNQLNFGKHAPEPTNTKTPTPYKLQVARNSVRPAEALKVQNFDIVNKCYIPNSGLFGFPRKLLNVQILLFDFFQSPLSSGF